MNVPDVVHMLPHRTDIVVAGRIVVEIPDKERVVLSATLVLCVEHVVLHVRRDSRSVHERVVLLTTISGVRTDLLTLTAVSVTERCNIRDESTLIGGPPEDTVVGYELVLGGYLDVVAGLGLSVVHRILLHAHESGVGVGLAIAVPFTKSIELVFVLLHLGDLLCLYLLHDLPQFLVADALPVHLVQYPVSTLSHFLGGQFL